MKQHILNNMAILSFLLVLTVSLSACARTADVDNGVPDDTTVPIVTPTPDAMFNTTPELPNPSAIIYTVEDISFTEAIRGIGGGHILDLTISADKLFFVHGASYGDDPSEISLYNQNPLYSLSFDGLDLAELSGYSAPIIPPSGYDFTFAYRFWYKMAFDSNGDLWVLELWKYYASETTVPDTIFEDEKWSYLTVSLGESYVIRKLDKTNGSEVLSVDISDIPFDTDLMTIVGSAVNVPHLLLLDGAGNFHLVFEGIAGQNAKTLVLNSNGEMQFSVDMGMIYQDLQLARTQDGTIAFLDCLEEESSSNTVAVLQTIDVEAKGLGESALLSVLPNWSKGDLAARVDSARQLFSGGEGYGILYNGESGESLYCLDVKTGETAHVLYWGDYGINPDWIIDITPATSGSIVCLYEYWEEESAYRIGIYILSEDR